MKIARFYYQREIRWGIVESTKLRILDGFGYCDIQPSTQTIPLRRARLLPPATPTKIVLVGLNYKDHARELHMPVPREPLIFLKPPSTLTGHKQAIHYPRGVKRLDYEAELAVIIKKKAYCIPAAQAQEYIFGYTCLNDVTARDLQKKDGQWTRAKSFDTFCPLGPWCETELDAGSVKVQSYRNGRLCQSSSTAQFIFSIETVIAFVSRVMSLAPGDVISTGTPSGIGSMKRGDTIAVHIEGIGTLENNVS